MHHITRILYLALCVSGLVSGAFLLLCCFGVVDPALLFQREDTAVASDLCTGGGAAAGRSRRGQRHHAAHRPDRPGRGAGCGP
ncbi:MAG: hypothetical protein ACLUNZ_01475 [Evtepia sp.]